MVILELKEKSSLISNYIPFHSLIDEMEDKKKKKQNKNVKISSNNKSK